MLIGTKPRSAMGLAVLVLSGLLWLLVPAVPFLPLSIARRAAIGGALLVLAEIAFWLGLVLLGPEVARGWRNWFPGSWWRKLRARAETFFGKPVS